MNYHSYKYCHNESDSLNCLVYKPKNYDELSKLPLIISLHGAGERGDDLGLIKRYGIHRVLKDEDNFPFIVVSPQCPENEIWEMHFKSLKGLVSSLINNYKVDADKLYLTGYSLGGYGTWNFATVYPNVFTAIAPISGGALIPKNTITLADVPVWTAHGMKDTAVLFNETERVVDILKTHNDNIVFKVFEDGGHEVCSTAYLDSTLYDWLQKWTKHK